MNATMAGLALTLLLLAHVKKSQMRKWQEEYLNALNKPIEKLSGDAKTRVYFE